MRNVRARSLGAALALHLLSPAAAPAAQTSQAQTPPQTTSAAAKRIRADVDVLASEKWKGRRAGTPEADLAAAFLVESFKKIGLLPGAGKGGYLQSFDYIDGVDLGPKNALSTAGAAPVGHAWSVGTDFRPLAFSAPGTVEDGEVVFAGYGISAKDPAWDDYAGLDVKGKVVLVLRYGPDGDDLKSPFSPYMALRYKASVAKEKGARALLVATGPETKDVTDELVALRTDASFADAGLPAFSIRRPVAESLFAGSGKTLAGAQKAIDATKKPSSFAFLSSRVNAVADVTPHRSRTANVIGVLPGRDPAVNTEVLVLGAHYDHLGLGGAGSLDATPGGRIHPGADDNASGVAGILELARTFAARRGTLRRSIVFVAFGAEEEGTLGSLHFTKNPPVPIEKIVAMVNLDMVGRLRNDTLDVHGVGTSPVWKPLVAKANETTKLKLVFHEGGFGPSDHSSFYAASRPVLFLFTGSHPDYHRPSDTPDKLNAEGEEKVLTFLSPIVSGVANADAAPAFTAVAADKDQSASASRGFKVWVGSIPDYSEEGTGVRLTGVSPGSPAEKAGLLGGDVIVKFGEKTIRNIYDYTYALQDRKPGDEVVVVVKRAEGGATVEKSFRVVLGSRPNATK